MTAMTTAIGLHVVCLLYTGCHHTEIHHCKTLAFLKLKTAAAVGGSRRCRNRKKTTTSVTIITTKTTVMIEYVGLSSQGAFVPITVHSHGQSTGIRFSSWAVWTGDWLRRTGMFEHIRFVTRIQLSRCTTAVLVTNGQRRVHCQTFCACFVIFATPDGFPWFKK